MAIKELLDTLSTEQKRLLNYAFEHQMSQHVELSNGRFVGVNVVANNLEITERAGVWSAGKVRKNEIS